MTASAGYVPSRYEEVLSSYATSGSATERLASAIRLVRLQRGGDPRTDVAASVAAPLLIGYVWWALEVARQACCESVAFVSRDGQILSRIAERVEAQRDSGRLEVRYVHGGRRVWHPAGLTAEVLDGPPPPWWIGEGMPRGEPASPLDMLALDRADLDIEAWDEIESVWAAPVAERPARLARLWSHPAIRRALDAVSSERRRLLCRYLEQAGLGRGRWAMVDVGWRGRSAVSLNRAISSEGLSTPLHLYIGLGKPDPELTQTGDWATYLFCRPGPDRAAGDLGGGLFSFVEIVCSADHGPVRRFEAGPSGVYSVLDPVDQAALDWGIPDVHRTILEVAEASGHSANGTDGQVLRHAIVEVMRMFLDDPDEHEVESWGSFPFAADPSGRFGVPWVAEWSRRDALRWALRGRPPYSYWPQASRAALPRSADAIIRAREGLSAWRSGRQRRSFGTMVGNS